jgi:hypothetical protein
MSIVCPYIGYCIIILIVAINGYIVYDYINFRRAETGTYVLFKDGYSNINGNNSNSNDSGQVQNI